ncbi:MAG: DUF748 domain-containing protein [Proteobacteria bacterium]|nr:DUF748 domain-containing protein [Pseudomonadota bacterium]
MRKRTVNLILSVTCVAFILLTLVPLLLSYYVGPTITRKILQESIEKSLQKKVEVERAGITIFRGFGIEYEKLRIVTPDGEEFFQTDAFILKPWIQSLIFGKIRWKSITLKDPVIHLTRTAEGQLNLYRKAGAKSDSKDKGFLHRVKDITAVLPSQLSVQGGRIRFTDFGISQNPIITEIEDIEVTSQDISTERPFSFNLTGRFAGDGNETFSIATKIARVEDPLDPDHLELELSVKADSVNSQRIWPYIRSEVPFEKMEGLLDLKIKHQGGFAAFRSSGEITIRNGQFTLPALYKTTIKPREISVKYDLDYEREEISISRLVARAANLLVSARGSVQKPYSSNPSISLELTTGRTSLEDIRPFLPDKLLPKKIISFLADPGARGYFEVEEVRLEGPWASLTGKGLRKNPEMLSVRLRLNDVRLLVDPKLPRARDISGLLTITNGQATLKGFRGRFLRTRLHQIEGSITRLYGRPQMSLTFKGDLDFKSLHSLLTAKRISKEIRNALRPITKASGKGKMTGQIRHRFDKLTGLTYQGRIALKGIRLGIAGFALPLTDLEGEVRYDEKSIRLSKFRWKMGKSLCQGNASIQGYLRKLKKKLILSNRMRISIDLGAGEIGFDRLLAKGKKKGNIQIDPKSIWTNSTITGKVRISKGSYRGFQVGNFEAAFVAKRGLLRLKNFHAKTPEGFLRFRGWFNLKRKRGISFKLIPEFYRLNMTNVIPVFLNHGSGPSISGSLNLDGIIAGSGNSVDSFTKSLRGDLRLQVSKGLIHGLESLQGKGLPYNLATAKIAIARGVASTKDLYMDSEEISMTIKGQADLANQSLDISIGIRPLQKVDKILTNVPLAGQLLAGKDRSILNFAYRVRGKFNDLKVETRQARYDKSLGR